jgi:hypothetical protein
MHAGPHMGSTARNVFSKEKNFELVICAVGDWASDRPPRALGSAVARECGIGFAQRSSGAAADSSLLSFQSAAAASSSRSRPSRKAEAASYLSRMSPPPPPPFPARRCCRPPSLPPPPVAGLPLPRSNPCRIVPVDAVVDVTVPSAFTPFPKREECIVLKVMVYYWNKKVNLTVLFIICSSFNLWSRIGVRNTPQVKTMC